MGDGKRRNFICVSQMQHILFHVTPCLTSSVINSPISSSSSASITAERTLKVGFIELPWINGIKHVNTNTHKERKFDPYVMMIIGIHIQFLTSHNHVRQWCIPHL